MEERRHGRPAVCPHPHSRNGSWYNPFAMNRKKGKWHMVTFRTQAGRWTVIVLCVALCAAAPAGTPAPGPESVLEVRLPDIQALQQLTDQGYLIDDVDGLKATIYATAEERTRLEAAGYPVTVVGSQPIHPENAKALGSYHFHADLTTELEAYAAAHADICRLYSIGASVQGWDLWVMFISDNPDTEEDEPEFKYISSLHGDETVGIELCRYFIDLLLNGYGVDSRITSLVDDTAISILPLANPDGMQARRRTNADGYDLNRSFPNFADDFTGTYFGGEALNATGRPKEVRLLMDWTVENAFVLSANYHGGALVVNYPYDYVPGISSGSDAPAPDDLLFEDLSLRYAIHNSPMYNSTRFTDGITNGSAWYSITGGLQDWSLRYAGCMDFTIELSNTKWPDGSTLPGFWADNQESMLAYLEAVHIGVRGLVTDRSTGEPVWAQVDEKDNAQPVFTDADVGDYHRLLLPGTVDLGFSAPGYIPYHVNGVVVEDGAATRVDVPLSDGDVNLDGSVGAADVQAAVNALLGYTMPYDADVDGRGVSATDVQAVVNKALKLPVGR